MELLSGVTLVNAGRRTTVANNYLSGKKYVAFYFSAHWCPPCRQFTPQLAAAYAASQGSRKGEVIFVSSDRSEEEMFSYMREDHGGWLAIDYKNSALRSTLNSRLEVHGIPALVVVNLFDGSVISQDARSEIASLGAAAFRSWDGLCCEVDTSVTDLLLKNEGDGVMVTACDVLNRLLSNIIKDPHNMKYRSVKLDNPRIASSLLNANGAFEVLFTVGFEESDGSLILPLNASIPLLTTFRDKIRTLIDGQKKDKTEEAISATPLMIPSSTAIASHPESEKDNTPQFLNKIMNEVELCRTYEDSVNQALALSCIPLERFEEASKKATSESKEDTKLKKDLILMELLLWFKNDFFKWVETPKCPTCNVEMVPQGSLPPTPEESKDGASTVESHGCSGCGSTRSFPRYHSNPSKLLETRVGRCGEWANCFALLARSMGYDVRRVLDWSDHVWVEVFSEHQDRWVHVDPCEGAIDKPLLYECGWNKELSYVIASSVHEVMDVTPRYVKDMKETKRRKRNLVPERWLTDSISNITDSLMGQLSKEQKDIVVQRRLKDLVGLMKEKQLDGSESLPGRQSGSSAWRLQRGEMGKLPKAVVWTPNDKEIKAKVFELSYDVVSDVYTRGDEERIAGWINGLSDMNDVFRKEESDWKMVYLARTENSTSGKLCWEVDLSGTSLSIKSVELRIESKTYENGRVLWQLCGNNVCLIPSPSNTLNSEGLAGAKKITLSASLSGGKGPNAWQHAQVFRFSSKEGKGVGLKLRIIMQEENKGA